MDESGRVEAGNDEFRPFSAVERGNPHRNEVPPSLESMSDITRPLLAAA